MSEATLAEQLIRNVEAADSAMKLADAVQALADARLEAAVPHLIAALNYNNPGAAVAAVDGLVALGEIAVAPLLDLIDNHNYTARAWAVRALAGIGDPRGLEILLEAASSDIALSVRRAAARGLGTLRWYLMPPEVVVTAQQRSLEVLCRAAQDPEWVVRYAAIVGLQSLAIAAFATQNQLVPQILQHLEQCQETDSELVIQARIQMAQQQISKLSEAVQLNMDDDQTESAESGWQGTLNRLYKRKSDERPIPEGDPRRFRPIIANSSIDPDGSESILVSEMLEQRIPEKKTLNA